MFISCISSGVLLQRVDADVWCCQGGWEQYNRPVGDYAGIVGLLVVVHPLVALSDESLLLTESSDDGGPQQRLIEVRVDG